MRLASGPLKRALSLNFVKATGGSGFGVAHVYNGAVVGPAEVGGELATPAELQRLIATLQGFPTTEEQDRQQLQVIALRCAQRHCSAALKCSRAATGTLHLAGSCLIDRCGRWHMGYNDTVPAVPDARRMGTSCPGGGSFCCSSALSAR